MQGADLTEGFAHLLAPDRAKWLAEPKDGEAVKIETRSRPDRGQGRSSGAQRAHLELVRPRDAIQRPNGPLPADTTNPGPNRDRGSNVTVLVLVSEGGLEPPRPIKGTSTTS